MPAFSAVALVIGMMASFQSAAQPVLLADRLPLPDGYGSEQDTESDGVRDFSTAAGVRGHILRRFVQSGDDKTSPVDLVAYFSSVIHDAGGFVFDDRVNAVVGRLDGRVPGERPLWVHVDVSDEGGVVDVVLLEERAPVAREMPNEERDVPGLFSEGVAAGMNAADAAHGIRLREQLAAKLTPILQPYRGWDWRLVAESANRVRLFGFARAKACASCSITTGSREVTLAIFTLDGGLRVDIPSRNAIGEVSLYQQDIISRIVAAKLSELIK